MAFCYVTGDSAASVDRGGFPFGTSSLTSSSALLTLWSPPHLAHFPLGCHHFIWLASLVLAPPPAPSNPLSPYVLTLQLVMEIVPEHARQVGTGAAAGCRLTWLCHSRSGSQFCFFFPDVSFCVTFQADIRTGMGKTAVPAALVDFMIDYSNCVVIFCWPRRPSFPEMMQLLYVTHNPHACVHIQHTLDINNEIWQHYCWCVHRFPLSIWNGCTGKTDCATNAGFDFVSLWSRNAV